MEIYTDKNGEVIFKKYSPMGEMSTFAGQFCDTIAKTAGLTAVVTDRDMIIAASGAARKELVDKRISEALERIMESRTVYNKKSGGEQLSLVDGIDKYHVGVAAPIIVEGDISGCVIFALSEGMETGDTELKLAQTMAGFLSRQMES